MDLLLPPACAGCGRSAGTLLCDTCRSRLRPPSDERDRFAAPDAGLIVGERLLLAMAAYAYEGPMRRALAALKYGGVSRVAPALAGLAVPTLCRLSAISGEAALVPVPVHAGRLAARGYDQAALLAGALGRQSRLPVRPVLMRVLATAKQHRLDRGARLRNLRGAFAASGRPPPIAILVDDIITTTATLESCAAVLHDAGCDAVYGLAIAREV